MPREVLDARDLNLYRQVETILREQIADGELRPGDRIPSEAALGTQFGVSRDTVRQALDALGRDDLIDRHVGRGTFVRALSAQAGEAPGRATYDWQAVVAMADSAPRLIRQSGVAAPLQVARTLGVAADVPVPFLIRMFDDEPAWGVKRYVHPRFKEAMGSIAVAANFQQALAEIAGPVTVSRFWAEAIQAEPRFAMLLRCPPGSPLMSMWWIDTIAGEAVACTQMLQQGLSFAVAVHS